MIDYCAIAKWNSLLSYYVQLSTGIKMYNYKIETSFVTPKILMARTNKTGYYDCRFFYS